MENFTEHLLTHITKSTLCLWSRTKFANVPNWFRTAWQLRVLSAEVVEAWRGESGCIWSGFVGLGVGVGVFKS